MDDQNQDPKILTAELSLIIDTDVHMHLKYQQYRFWDTCSQPHHTWKNNRLTINSRGVHPNNMVAHKVNIHSGHN